VRPWSRRLCTHVSVTRKYTLVANERWCSAAVEVTAGLAESNGTLPPGFGHLRADCRGPASAPEPYARFEYGTTQYLLSVMIVCRIVAKIIMPPPLIGGALSDDAVWRLFVCRVHRA